MPPTFDPQTQQRAQGIRETITGPSQGGQLDWFKQQQGIENQLRAQGMKDSEIEQNPQWQEASRNLSRSVSAGATSTAIGEAAGGAAGAALAPPIKMVAGVVRDALGTEAKQLAKDVVSEGSHGAGLLVNEAKAPIAAAEELEKIEASKPAASIIDLKHIKPLDTGVDKARVSVQQGKVAAAQAEKNLAEAQQRLDKVSAATTNPNAPKVRAARKEVLQARNKVTEATRAHEAAVDAQVKATNQYQKVNTPEAMRQRAETAAAQERATAAQRAAAIRQSAADAKETVRDLEGLRAQLNASNLTPEKMAGIARDIGKRLQQSGKMSEEQYKEYAGRVNDMLQKTHDIASARRLLRNIAVGAIGTGGGSYALRRIFY
jgi:hypothetical protein